MFIHHTLTQKQSTPLVAGLSVAAAAYFGKTALQQYVRWAARPARARAFYKVREAVYSAPHLLRMLIPPQLPSSPVLTQPHSQSPPSTHNRAKTKPGRLQLADGSAGGQPHLGAAGERRGGAC